MKPSFRALVLSLSLAAFALPARAHKPLVFVPQPRQVGTEVQYRVVILASNLDHVDRRFQVNRIVPQPFGEPQRQLLHGGPVPSGQTFAFTVSDLNDSAGLLEVWGSRQIMIRARLEIFEGGQRIRTVALPAVTSHEHSGKAQQGPVLRHGVEHDLHLQGLSRTADGSVSTDLTVVNFDSHAAGECAMSIVDAHGAGILVLPFLTLPAGAAIAINDVLADTGVVGDILDAWGAVACEEDTFTIWAAVYRDNGRDVEYVLPSAELR
jgi:hypothetical protein